MKNTHLGMVSEIERCTTVDGPGIRTIVFLKGCPLRCAWCHNPEDYSSGVQIGWDAEKCIGCLRCVQACPRHAITRDASRLITDYGACNSCLECVKICPARSRKQYGRCVDVESVFEEVIRDVGFYRSTNGGVTVSGGEPLMQGDFTRALFKLCREARIHTALDTSGYAKAETLDAVLDETDLVLLDLKQMDQAMHKRFTGVDPGLILDNLKRIDERRIPTWIRTPIVPGYTDQEENIKAIAGIVEGTACVERWELLPYHGFGSKKYSELQMRYPLRDLERPTDDQMRNLRAIAMEYCGPRVIVR